MSKRKKVIRIIIGVVTGSFICFLAGVYGMFREQLAAMGTIRKLDKRLYYMEYAGDYGFEEFLSRGGAASDEEVGEYLTEFLSHGFYRTEVKTQKQGCSTVKAESEEGGFLFGRNYDWKDCTIMIVKTKPKNGYASVSTCNIDYLGFGEGYLPEGMKNKMLALASVYVPLDGMNEKGLCVADLMIDVNEKTDQNSMQGDLTTTTAIRLLLDQAADVEEAIELLKQYNMHSSAGLMHHLAISDQSGNSVVAEYVDQKLVVTKTPVVTNFFLAQGEKQGIGSRQSKKRFSILESFLSENEKTDVAGMRDALQSVSQRTMGEEFEKTVWSIVYDQKNGELHYFFREDYKREYPFTVK